MKDLERQEGNGRDSPILGDDRKGLVDEDQDESKAPTVSKKKKNKKSKKEKKRETKNQRFVGAKFRFTLCPKQWHTISFLMTRMNTRSEYFDLGCPKHTQ